jgi:hypothetical protein
MVPPSPKYSQRSLRIYAAIFAGSILLSLPLAISWRSVYATTFLKAAGELDPVQAIVARQRRLQTLYGSALFEDDFQYKIELIRARRPDLVAIGSSRALQFRQEFFSAPFTSAGRGMNSIDQGERFVDEMLKIHRPKAVLLAIDVWWLNPRRREPPMRGRDLARTRPLVSTFWAYVNERKLTLAKTLRVLLGDDSNPVSLRRAIGISGLARGGGYRPDGSRDYGARYFGTDPTFDDKNFVNSKGLVRNGESPLEFGQAIDETRLATLNRLVTKLKDAGVGVVAVLPPIAPTVLDLMARRKDGYAYIAPARAAYQTLPVRVFDFLESQSLDNNECEFADGLHAGDVTYQRMLLRIAETDPSGPLTPFIRKDAIAAGIRSLSGHTVTPTVADGYRYPEIDFLGIGCRKGVDLVVAAGKSRQP